MDTNDRIKSLIEDLGITPYEFSKKMGNKRPDGLYKILDKKSQPSPKTLEKIKNAFPDIDYHWLVTGQKIGKDDVANQTSEKGIPSVVSNKGGVPYYDVDFYGGFDFTFNDQTIRPAFFIDYAPYNDCDAWINVSGKSMSPFISHGDIAALKKLNNWREFIPFGEIYAVLTEEHKTIKIVTAGKDDDHLTLVPYNKSREFVEQQVPKKLIHQMYRVKGSIKKFF